MATTDARPGFKLPWSAERTESDAPPASDPAPEASAEAPQADVAPAPVADTGPATADAASMTPVPGSFDPWRLAANPATPMAEVPRRKPNKLMADLTRAMQQAAESARDETLERLQADATAFIESVHARSGTQADDLRRTADEDIAGIREWSKAEIARIREETDQRITDRKVNLDGELETHAARIEAQIERVQQHVARFEAEMAGFFERLLGEDDPTRLAGMAENLPEPPSFEDDLVELPAAPVATVIPADEPAGELTAEPEPTEAEAVAPDVEAETTVEQATDDVSESQDPRLFAMGLTPEAAAEAEAEAELDPSADGDEIESFSDDALNARLAGLVPAEGEVPQADVRSTSVIVTGLVSVASIASFKRHLGQLQGVTAVGVSSGPDGEFVFAVTHVPDLDVAGAVPTLPGFTARVTDTTPDTVTVAARDPETAS
jgi:hypothetical protein